MSDSENDSNVQFIINAIYDYYQNTEVLWTDTENVPQILNFTRHQDKKKST